MRALFKEKWELIKCGFVEDEHGGLKKGSFYLESCFCNSKDFLGKYHEISRCENGYIAVKFVAGAEGWYPLELVKSDIDLKYYLELKDLGILLDIPFRIKEKPDELYKINLEGIFEYSHDFPYQDYSLGHDTSIIDGILSGKYTVITGKWKPSEGDWYYSWSRGRAYREQWSSNSFRCFYDYLTFNCFPSEIMAKVYGSEFIDLTYESLKVDFECADGLDNLAYEVQKAKLKQKVTRRLSSLPQWVAEKLAEEKD